MGTLGFFDSNEKRWLVFTCRFLLWPLLKKKKIQPADEAANILSPAICHNSSYDNNNRKRITSVIKHSRRDSSQAKCFFFFLHTPSHLIFTAHPWVDDSSDSYFADEKTSHFIHALFPNFNKTESGIWISLPLTMILLLLSDMPYPRGGLGANEECRIKAGTHSVSLGDLSP